MNKNTKVIIIIVLIVGIIFSFNISNSLYKKSDDDIKQVDTTVYDNGNDLFKDYYDEAEEIMENMTMENKLSQLFIIRSDTPLYGNDMSYIGGFILYGSFFKTRNVNSVNSYVSSLQLQSKIRYAIAVDEEGGTVARISGQENFRKKRFLSPQKLYKKGGLELILETEDEKDELLKSLQINLNLAPVADVSTDKKDFMNDRTLGESAEVTAEYIAEVTKRAKENGISTCLKHFPGYGNNDDTHYDIVIDKRELSELEENDFLPFIAGIEAGTPFIMNSHNILESVDSEYPTSLSRKVIDILKNDLGYTGIIMTDDISMDALKKYNDQEKASILALQAGNDMIMTSNYPLHFRQLVNGYKNGEISAERVNYSVRKIIAWKLAYGIIEE